MKIEKIRFNKIKVTFSTEELITQGITPEAVRKNSSDVQEIFYDVLRRAEEETGFSVEGGRIMIEAHTLPDESLVLYITKLLDDDEPILPLMPRKKVKMRIRAVDPASSNGETCLMFDSFEDVVSLAALNDNLSGGELYFYKDRYYLIISSDSEASCSEFGRSVPSRFFGATLREHGRLVCSDAAEKLRENFR